MRILKITTLILLVLSGYNTHAQNENKLKSKLYGSPKKVTSISYFGKKRGRKVKKGAIANGLKVNNFYKEYNFNGDLIKYQFINKYGKPTSFFIYDYNKDGYLVNEIHKRENIIYSKTIYFYHNSNLSKEQHFILSNISNSDSISLDSNGTVNYFYNNLNQLIKSESFESNSYSKSTVQYQYNNDGKLEKSEFFKNDTITRTINFEYDTLGRLTSRENFDEHGDLFGYLKKEYLAHGDTIRTERRYSPGQEIVYQFYIYNENGDLIKFARNFGNNSIRFTSEYDYKYDEYNNWIERIPIEKKPIITVRTIEYW